MTVTDGRVQRGARNREAIIDALLACYEDGALLPSVADVAERAGVSARSVHNHFEDVEALRAEVAERQRERFVPLLDAPVDPGPLAARVATIVERRATFFEAVTPVRRAALLSRHESPTIARNLARLDRVLRRQLQSVFADELAAPGRDARVTLDALDTLLSWDTWHRLRVAQDCSPARATRVLVASVTALLGGHSS